MIDDDQYKAPQLSAAHRMMLERGSAISPEVITARGYLTARNLDELERCVNETGGQVYRWTESGDDEPRSRFGVLYARTGWAGKAKEKLSLRSLHWPCLVLPQHWAGQVTGHRFRPDAPAPDGPKYVALTGSRNRLDANPAAWPLVTGPSVPLLITEGEKKSDALASAGAAAVTVTGVWNWLARTEGKDSPGVPVAEFADIPLSGRDVHLVYDSDARSKPGVALALADLTAFLWTRGAVVWWTLPPAAHKGADDYLAAGGTLDGLLSGAVRADAGMVAAADPGYYRVMRQQMTRQEAQADAKRRREEGSAPTDESWQPADLSALLGEDAGEPVAPDRLTRDDGEAVAYSGCCLWLWGAPGTGKTFTALVWAGQEIRAGRHVLWIDLESQARQTAQKLLTACGCTRDQLRDFFHLVQPAGPLTGAARDGVLALAGRLNVSLAVIDAVTDLLALQGADPNAADAVAQLDQRLITPLKRAGAAVAVIDHVAKNAGHGWPVNSQHKKACADMGLEAETVAAFTRDRAGFLKLTCYKDRNGTWAGEQVVSFVVVAHGRARLTMRPDLATMAGMAAETAADPQEAGRQARRVAVLKLVSDHPGEHTVSSAATALALLHHKEGAKDGMGRERFYTQIKDMRDCAGAEITERGGKLYPAADGGTDSDAA